MQSEEQRILPWVKGWYILLVHLRQSSLELNPVAYVTLFYMVIYLRMLKNVILNKWRWISGIGYCNWKKKQQLNIK